MCNQKYFISSKERSYRVNYQTLRALSNHNHFIQIYDKLKHGKIPIISIIIDATNAMKIITIQFNIE